MVMVCKDPIRDLDGIPGEEKSFKFEAKWLHVDAFKDVVADA